MPGEIAVREGDRGDRFFVIVDGRYEVSPAGRDGESLVLRELGRGDGFGEIGLLLGSLRTATVTALTDGLLLVLEREPFLDLVGPGADLRTGMLARCVGVGDH